jgi:hypothetical protein
MKHSITKLLLWFLRISFFAYSTRKDEDHYSNSTDTSTIVVHTHTYCSAQLPLIIDRGGIEEFKYVCSIFDKRDVAMKKIVIFLSKDFRLTNVKRKKRKNNHNSKQDQLKLN